MFILYKVCWFCVLWSSYLERKDANWVRGKGGESFFFLLLAVALVLEIVEGLDIGGRALVLNLADAGGVQVPLVLATATGACSFC